MIAKPAPEIRMSEIDVLAAVRPEHDALRALQKMVEQAEAAVRWLIE